MPSTPAAGTGDGVSDPASVTQSTHPVAATAGGNPDTAGLPRHVAIIMDGNGRWAQQRELVRVEGHRQGVSSVRQVTEQAARLGIEQLTLFCLSSENWRRPKEELDFLMLLLKQYMIEERPLLLREQIRLVMIGDRTGLPADTLAAIDETVALCSENTGMRLCLAVNYGGRAEITAAAKSLAKQAAAGELDPDTITEASLAAHLETAGMPDPDLLIRTAGEMRVSNFLLWQMSYAELWVTPAAWPEFTADHLDQAIAAYRSRERRFGGLTAS